eukprot:92315_1
MTTNNGHFDDVVPPKESATRPTTRTDMDPERLLDAEDMLPIAQDLICGLTTDVQLLTEKMEKLTQENIALEKLLRDERRQHELNELELMSKLLKREHQILELVVYIKNHRQTNDTHYSQ